MTLFALGPSSMLQLRSIMVMSLFFWDCFVCRGGYRKRRLRRNRSTIFCSKFAPDLKACPTRSNPPIATGVSLTSFMVSTATDQPKAYIAVLLVLGSTHSLNNLLQALIPAMSPNNIKDKYALDFVQIGLITLTFQISGSLLQPLVGHYTTDQHPMPYSTAIGMIFTLVGVVCLAFANSCIIIYHI